MKHAAGVALSQGSPSRNTWTLRVLKGLRQKVETKPEDATSKSLDFLLTYSTRSIMSIFPNPSPRSSGDSPTVPSGPPAPPSAPPPPPSAPPPATPYASIPYYPPPPPPAPESGTGMKIPVLFGAVIALLGGVVYLYMQLDHVKKDLAANNATMQAQLDKLVEASSLTTRTNSRRVDELKEQLEKARRQAAQA